MLVLQEFVHGREAVEPAVAAPLESTFFKLVPDNGPVIDPDGPCIDFSGYAERG